MKNSNYKISKETPIEELIEVFPPAITLLSKYGIRCLICGEPSWGTVGSAAKEKFITEPDLDIIIKELNSKYNDYIKEKTKND
ncbi:MAG TPA: DUF1858 domain-containing protein [Bacteroidota bacterium]|jgi:hypothetical protein|nr:DUF1858 domain-containing protein [Bacteroidota bacterium]